jgi:haloacetate dehalogenase
MEHAGVRELPIFPGFALETMELPEATLRVRHGGRGPPLLLLHGHPRTHTTWHRVAPLLAPFHTVVCPDLRGFGRSSQPADTPDHAGSSKRAKTRDCVALMGALGHERFALAGHDRGAYTAFRTAMDHPERVSRLAVLDAVPILDALERCDGRLAAAWWHWFFLRPEGQARAGDPGRPRRLVSRLAGGDGPGQPRGLPRRHPRSRHRARHARGLSRRSRPRPCPRRRRPCRRAGARLPRPGALVAARRSRGALWRRAGGMAALGPGPARARLDSGHHMAEEAPEALAGALLELLAPERAANAT